jgi:hypothetical protein
VNLNEEDCDAMFTPGVHVLGDAVYVYDEHGEIVMWHRDEFAQDPSAALAMANALQLYYEHGPYVLRRRLNKEIGPYDALRWMSGQRDYQEAPEEVLYDTEAVEMAIKGFFNEHPEVASLEWEQEPEHHDEWVTLKIKRDDDYLFVFNDSSYEVFDADDVVVLETDVINEELPQALHDDVQDYVKFGALLYESMNVLRGVYGSSAKVQASRDGSIQHQEHRYVFTDRDD